MRKNRKTSAFKILMGLLFSIGIQMPVRAEKGGTSTAQFLNLTGEVRGTSMAGAYSACANDVTGIWYNPATIARSRLSSLSLMHNIYLENIQMDALGAAVPLKFQSAAGLGFIMTNSGSIESFDRSGNRQGSYNPRDMALTLALAKMFRTTSLGISGKLVNSKIQNSAQTFAIDAGIHQELGAYSIALAFQNFGGSLKFNKESEPLPRKIRLGTSWNPSTHWLLNFDYIKPQETSGWMAVGTEYNTNLKDVFGIAIRGGYNTLYSDTNGLSGITAGAGFSFAETNLNYAWVPFGELGQTHRLSMLFQFQSPLKKDQTFTDYELAMKAQNVISRQKSWTQTPGHPSAKAKVSKPALPEFPWKKSRVRPRTAEDRIMEILSRDALCPPNGPHAMATRVLGKVQMKRFQSDDKWERVEKGQYFFEGDSFQTNVSARAQLVFANGTEVEVGPDTAMEFTPSGEVCEIATLRMSRGELKTKIQKGKGVDVTTPYGTARLKESKSQLSLKNKELIFEVIEGSGEFKEKEQIFQILEGEAFTKYSDALSTSAVKTEEVRPAAKKSMAAGFPPAPPITPGRWDPKLIDEFKSYMKELGDIEGIKVSEYLRDKKLRDDFKSVINKLLMDKMDLQNQVHGYEQDINNFKELKKTLAIPKLNETREEKRDRKLQRRDVADALKQARENFKLIRNDLSNLLKDIRINQDMWAAIPIVRLINITAKESVIPFQTGASIIPEESMQSIERIAESIVKINPSRILVEGHTDKMGSVDSNIKLSKKRATAVAKILRQKTKLPRRKFLIKGMGPFIPLDEGDSPEALSKNRRVEIWLELKGL